MILTSLFSHGGRPPPAACPSDQFQASLSACPSAAGSQSADLKNHSLLFDIFQCLLVFVFSHLFAVGF